MILGITAVFGFRAARPHVVVSLMLRKRGHGAEVRDFRTSGSTAPACAVALEALALNRCDFCSIEGFRFRASGLCSHDYGCYSIAPSLVRQYLYSE